MKNQVITEITRQMLPYLDNAQMEHLQEVLQHCLWNVEITSSGKNTELFVRETNEEMLEMFLSAKRVEGCSEKTLRYYETSLLRMFSEVDMHVTKMKTDDLRNYLSEYQQRTQCSRGNIDNIRRICKLDECERFMGIFFKNGALCAKRRKSFRRIFPDVAGRILCLLSMVL